MSSRKDRGRLGVQAASALDKGGDGGSSCPCPLNLITISGWREKRLDDVGDERCVVFVLRPQRCFQGICEIGLAAVAGRKLERLYACLVVSE